MAPNAPSRDGSGDSSQNNAAEGNLPQPFHAALREEDDGLAGSPDTVRRVRPEREGRDSGGTYGMRTSTYPGQQLLIVLTRVSRILQHCTL